MVVMNLANPTITPREVTVTLMLKTQASGGYVASVIEFPSCQVEAETKEEAIALIQATLSEQIANVETIPWTIALPTIADEPAWMKFVGIFQDDADFAAVMDELRAERESDDDSEIDPAYYLEA
jgi:predicted RNase H-like HicB family nuclease